MLHKEYPTWSLCIATLNRRDALIRTLDFAARQTCPPSQIVVVDVSEDWEDCALEARHLLEKYPKIALDYVTSQVRSSATQRNAGIKLCQHEIVFLLDDDSFLYDECAEKILEVYASDHDQNIAAIAITMVPDLPPEPSGSHFAKLESLEKKASGRNRAGELYRRVMATKLGRWFNRRVLLQSKEELFIKYDGSRQLDVPFAAQKFDVFPVSFVTGGASAVRRTVALEEPFDSALRYYAAFEDLDVAYRYAKHGALLKSRDALLHHYEAAGGRLKRKKLVIFQLLNMLIFLKRNAQNPDQFKWTYRILVYRRLFGEALKDLLSGRVTFPQARGVWQVIQTWKIIWDKDTKKIDEWYPLIQKDILEGLK